MLNIKKKLTMHRRTKLAFKAHFKAASFNDFPWRLIGNQPLRIQRHVEHLRKLTMKLGRESYIKHIYVSERIKSPCTPDVIVDEEGVAMNNLNIVGRIQVRIANMSHGKPHVGHRQLTDKN